LKAEKEAARMRSFKEIPMSSKAGLTTVQSWGITQVDQLAGELETNGIVVLSNLLSAEQLAAMQEAFAARLSGVRWNNVDGYQKIETYRHMVEDVLLLDQSFVDLAVHPLVKQILNRYLGTNYELTEAKGWKSLPTKRDFHGWHGDAWYDQTTESEIHREIKLAMYLTDVRSGAFNFIKGSHRQHHPRSLKNHEVADLLASQLVELTGPAGTAFLFDTSGIHRQGVPMLDPRQAIFYNYHDPRVRLQSEDVTYYRYHPLLLNAAFLGNLSDEDQRILGFGNKANFQPAFRRQFQIPFGYKAFNAAFDAQLRVQDLGRRINARLRRAFS
jgi:phytanoyl-CoA dioxygenase PhyH